MRREFFIILAFFLVFLTACSSGNNADGNVVKEIPSVGEIKEFDMVAKQWEFDPETITVNDGDTVKLHIKSIDVDHGIAIHEFEVNEYISAGETIDIEFVADKTGEFIFYCNVFCGADHKQMKGTLIVQ